MSVNIVTPTDGFVEVRWQGDASFPTIKLYFNPTLNEYVIKIRGVELDEDGWTTGRLIDLNDLENAIIEIRKLFPRK